jgi:hypothetical protein
VASLTTIESSEIVLLGRGYFVFCPPSIQPQSPLCFTTHINGCYWSEESFLLLRSDPPVHNLNNRSHGQNRRSTPGQAEPIAQYFFKKSTTGLKSQHPPTQWYSTVVAEMNKEQLLNKTKQNKNRFQLSLRTKAQWKVL